MRDPAQEFWLPEPLFEGRTVFCLASGPGLTPAVAAKVKHQASIVINASLALAPWAPVWFFTDSYIWQTQQALCAAYRGRIVTFSRQAKAEGGDRVCRIKAQWMPGFPPPQALPLRQGRSSGHTAISLAIACGARRVVLLGYDMRLVDGTEHCHSAYAGRPRDLDIYQREFIPAFKGWHGDALARGIEIVNATPGSAVTEFPMVDLDDELCRLASEAA